MELEIRRLSPELAEDFLYFFDEIAFRDHPEWSPCYCLESHLNEAEEDRFKDPQARREKAEEMVKGGIMHGYLAYQNQQPVGWCNADEKSNFVRIMENDRYWSWNQQGKTLSVYCFLIAPGARRQGVGQAMQDRVCEDAAAEGYQAVEGYPVKISKEDPEWMLYHGPAQLYRKCGFQEHSFQGLTIMRKEFNKRSVPVIGITGSIASGKSTAGRYLEEKCAVRRIDADQVAHKVLEEPAIVKELTNAFGKDILDKAGKIDRARLGNIVFSDPEALARLNGITHPPVCRKIQAEIEAFRLDPGNSPFLLLEAIELLRTPLKDMVDEIWVVWAEDRVRVRRVMERQHLTEEEAWARVRSQWPQEKYKAAADVLIDGGGTVEELYPKLDRLRELVAERKTAVAFL